MSLTTLKTEVKRLAAQAGVVHRPVERWTEADFLPIAVAFEGGAAAVTIHGITFRREDWQKIVVAWDQFQALRAAESIEATAAAAEVRGYDSLALECRRQAGEWRAKAEARPARGPAAGS
jgi:hypothetical protein